MNNIIKRVWNQNRLVNIEDLTGMVFQAEIGGHTFEISGIDDTGAAVEQSGTVSGVFRRPDNADIALTGSASDGVVSVTLSEDCYAVPGRFGLTIFVTSNSQKVAVYACVGTVAVSSTGNVAGDTPANVEDLIDDINAAIADLNTAIGSIPADYSQFMAAIAPAYSSSALYAVGSYAWYNGSLYRCITPITTAEAWTAAHWTAAVLGDDVCDLKSALVNSEDYIRFGIYIPAKVTKYETIVTPAVGQICNYKNPTDRSQFEDITSIYIDNVKPGEKFHYIGKGYNGLRCYAWLKLDGEVIDLSGVGPYDADITAPTNAAVLVCNWNLSQPYSLFRYSNIASCEQKINVLESSTDTRFTETGDKISTIDGWIAPVLSNKYSPKTYNSIEENFIYSLTYQNGVAYNGIDTYNYEVSAGDVLYIDTSVQSNPAYAVALFYHDTSYIGGAGFDQSGPVYNYRVTVPAGANLVRVVTDITPTVRAVSKTQVNNKGLYVSNNTYYCFMPYGDKFIITRFNQRGINNLFQWTGLYIGYVDENGVDIDETIAEYTTDIIGPISIWNGVLFPGNYGEWTGGNHGIMVNSVNCPTARQKSLSVSVDGRTVLGNGLYYGNVHFCAVNELFFAQSISGETFDGATLAIEERRNYWVSDSIKVDVKLDFKENTRISLYYGMQFVTIGFNTINLYNNEYSASLASVTSDVNMPEKENLITLENNSIVMSMKLNDLGLGTYKLNDGVKKGFAHLPSQNSNKKVYYVLGSSNTSDPSISAGDVLFWVGEYKADLI